MVRYQIIASLIFAISLSGCVAQKTTGTTEQSIAPEKIQKNATPAPSGNELIAAVQKGLLEQGYNPGKIDGLFGKNSKKAIRDLQKANNLPVNSKLSPEVLNLLAIDKNLIERNKSVLHYFDKTKEPAKPQSTTKPKMTASATHDTYLMRSPSIMAESLVPVPAGTTLPVAEKIGNFYKVTYRGQYGFLYEGSSTLVSKE